MMNTFIIDRFEGDFAVCEANEEMVNIPKALLPNNAKEGDVITEQNGKYTVDADKTENRRKNIQKLIDDLWG